MWKYRNNESIATPRLSTISTSGPKEKRSDKPRSEVPLIKSNDGRLLVEVLVELRNNAKPRDARVDVKPIRQKRIDSILVELGPKTDKYSRHEHSGFQP